jgi:hypothetical protein
MPNRYNRVLNVWCWPLLKLLQLLESALGWKHKIDNNGTFKLITLSNTFREQIFVIHVEKSVPDEDLQLNPSFRRTRLDCRVEVTAEHQVLHEDTMKKINEILDNMPEPKPFLRGIIIDGERKTFEFTIGVTENEGNNHRLMIDRPVQEQYALTIYQFFRVILGVWECPKIPSIISFAKWNKRADRKRKVPESERGEGGAAVDTESDDLVGGTESDEEEEEEQSNHVDRELDRVIPALAGHVNQRAAPVVEAGGVSVVPAVDGKIVKEEEPGVKLPLRAPVKKEEQSVDLTAEDDPVVKKEEVSVDLTAEDDPVAKTDVVDLT